jgi:putative SOS response-associated peptidase YedK
MCGRYSIILPPEAIRELFRTYGELPNWPAWYNAAPTTALPVVRQAKDGGQSRASADAVGLDPVVLQGWQALILDHQRTR